MRRRIPLRPIQQRMPSPPSPHSLPPFPLLNGALRALLSRSPSLAIKLCLRAFPACLAQRPLLRALRLRLCLLVPLCPFPWPRIRVPLSLTSHSRARSFAIASPVLCVLVAGRALVFCSPFLLVFSSPFLQPVPCSPFLSVFSRPFLQPVPAARSCIPFLLVVCTPLTLLA